MALRKEQIIDEALQLLHKDGLEGVTLRKLAKKLGVQPSALYWHIRNKEMLVNEMAEVILLKEFPNIDCQKAEESWEDLILQLFTRLRRALLSYRDGGRVVADANLSRMLAKLTERGIETFVNAGIDLQSARLKVLTAIHYTFGYVLDEQTTPSPEAIKHFNLDQFKKEHPLISKGIEDYFASGKTGDDLFQDGLKIIVGNGA
ncbi:TetR/AcrR family transcriptional regulator C-terminal domain-containing protein [Neobacillus jeddahensis]|uniref:TetR/AcrR family transcriptional regulator C-terminal domain-containing protein n=1 Tax=Neobacillus jeddahensis TaxID=1461580 RepID=UPI00058CB630|nr:TetR/AcrR family transcriptional regulator C-terminal domain-containing protein [Neobacillus jeddahensis]